MSLQVVLVYFRKTAWHTYVIPCLSWSHMFWYSVGPNSIEIFCKLLQGIWSIIKQLTGHWIDLVALVIVGFADLEVKFVVLLDQLEQGLGSYQVTRAKCSKKMEGRASSYLRNRLLWSKCRRLSSIEVSKTDEVFWSLLKSVRFDGHQVELLIRLIGFWHPVELASQLETNHPTNFLRFARSLVSCPARCPLRIIMMIIMDRNPPLEPVSNSKQFEVFRTFPTFSSSPKKLVSLF